MPHPRGRPRREDARPRGPGGRRGDALDGGAKDRGGVRRAARPGCGGLLILIALERREVDASSLAVIRRVRELALERIRKVLSVLLDAFDPTLAHRLAGEFAPFVLCVADGAFVAQHIEPGTDLRQTFSLLRRALTALAREIIASTAHEGDR